MKKYDNMIRFGENIFYIDLDALDEIVSSDESLKAKEITDVETTIHKDSNGKIISIVETHKKNYKPKEINVSRYEMITTMLDLILRDNEYLDDSLGYERAFRNLPFNYRIAFNTLLETGVIKIIK